MISAKNILLLLGLILAMPAFGQLRLQWQAVDSMAVTWVEQQKPIAPFADSAAVVLFLEENLNAFKAQAYLTASVDSLEWGDSTVIAHLYLGPVLRFSSLENGNLPEWLLEKVRFREGAYRDKLLGGGANGNSPGQRGANGNSPGQRGANGNSPVRGVEEALLEEAENAGYPFARIWLDSLSWKGPAFTAGLYWESGPAIEWAPVQVEGEVKLAPVYLQQYLGLRPGTPYSRRKVLEARNRLRELPFVRETKDPVVEFLGQTAALKLFLERKKASRLDFLVGVLPTNNEGPTRKLLITGTFNAEFQNAFGKGERIYASFEQLRPGTQELELAFTYPYLLQLPFGIDLGFNQYKRDSTFNDVIFDLGLRYLMPGGNYLRAFWNRSSSSLISIDQERVLQTRQLPSTLDVQVNAFGLELLWQKLDYRFNPRKGWSLGARASAGTKTIEPNPAITGLQDPEDPGFDFTTLYDTLDQKTYLVRLTGDVGYFFPVFSSFALYLRNRSGWVYSPQSIYRNEQIRIGGNRLLRGFDEESIFATLYSVFSLEYRLLLDGNSYLYAFGDYGYVEDRTTTTRRFDRPAGLGVGLTFETPVGIFGISVAVGQQFNQGFDFRNPKLHFGYVSVF
ncbi:MAG: BamA/TamA family outer membrane protein [Saprospirales bacterium]|nr:BamA/TamA family outer membrane protein [Saprospirales bacterium]